MDAKLVSVVVPVYQGENVHGAAWNPSMTPIRWIPDAVAVLSGTPNFDWERALAQARKRRLTLMVAGALDYLRQSLGGFVPRDVVCEFKQSTVSGFESREYEALLDPSASVLATFKRVCFHFWRQTEGKPLSARIVSIPEYLCSILRTERKRELPCAIGRRVLRRLARSVRSDAAAQTVQDVAGDLAHVNGQVRQRPGG